MKSNPRSTTADQEPQTILNLGLGYLPDFILREVAKPPTAGQGVHDFLYWLALKLHPYRSVDQIHAILREFGDSCGRYVPNQEIEDAIRNSFPYAWQGRGPMPSSAFKGSALSAPASVRGQTLTTT